MQTWLLYQNAISSGVAIEDILKYARMTKEKAREEVGKDESSAAIAELKKQLAAQDAQIKYLLSQNSASASTELAKPVAAPFEGIGAGLSIIDKASDMGSAPKRVPFSTTRSDDSSGRVLDWTTAQVSPASRVVPGDNYNGQLSGAPGALPIRVEANLGAGLPALPSSPPKVSRKPSRPKTPNASRPESTEAQGGSPRADPGPSAGARAFRPVSEKRRSDRAVDIGVAGLPSALSNPGELTFRQPDALPPRDSMDQGPLLFSQPVDLPPRDVQPKVNFSDSDKEGPAPLKLPAYPF